MWPMALRNDDISMNGAVKMASVRIRIQQRGSESQKGHEQSQVHRFHYVPATATGVHAEAEEVVILQSVHDTAAGSDEKLILLESWTWKVTSTCSEEVFSFRLLRLERSWRSTPFFIVINFLSSQIYTSTANFSMTDA